MRADWYYFKGEKRIGPVSPQQLKGIASDGTLQPTDPVWKEGMSKAVPAEKIKGLFDSAKALAETQAPEAPSSSTSSEIGWYYALGDQHNGPVQLQRLLELIASNQLCATDLVWNESLPNWISASEAPELTAALPARQHIPPASAGSAGRLFKGIFEETKANFKKGWDEGQRDTPSKPLADSPSAAMTEGKTVPEKVEQPHRLPVGILLDDVVVQCHVEYRGGHPTQTEGAAGHLYLTKSGLFFVATQPSLDIAFSPKQLLDILAPAPGSFSKEMLAKAEQAQAVSGMGRQLSSFAGALVGGVGGAAIRAIGNSASGIAASKNILGPPPKNRLHVISVESGARHKLIFDVMANDKQDMEQQADGFWRKVASVRSAFASAARKPASVVASAIPVSTPATQAGFFIARAGVVSGPFTDATVKEMLANGELANNDLIRVETWLPISVIHLFGATTPAVQGSAAPIQAVTANSPKPLAEGANRAEPAKRKSSAAPMIAAGVGGIVAGAAAATLLTPGSAQAASTDVQARPFEDHDVHGVVMDTNGDGVIDTVGVGLDHDGHIDAVGVDIDGDGEVDAVGVDTDHDGQIDAVGIDRDGDGHIDAYGVDSDHDGELDTFGGEDFQDDNMDIAENDQGESFDDFDDFA